MVFVAVDGKNGNKPNGDICQPVPMSVVALSLNQ